MLPQKFTYPFSYAPHPLVREAAGLLVSRIESDTRLKNAFAEGKMLGVLLTTCRTGCVVPVLPDNVDRIVLESCPECVVLCAFSGNVTVDGKVTNTLDGFVPPIYDLLDPDGHFKKTESEISLLNLKIFKLEKSLAKSSLNDGERMAELALMRARRRELSEYLQKWIFDRFVVRNAKGESRSVSEIFSDRGLIPPGGTAECALPKLLQFAYSNALTPRCFGEFWYGKTVGGEVRTHGSFYPSCSGKCGVLLPYMLEGLELEENPLNREIAPKWNLESNIVYEDDSLIVVNKPSGMLSVPGKKTDMQGKNPPESLLELLQHRANSLAGALPRRGPKVYSVHRLDMDTSGLIVFAKTSEAQKDLMSQFESSRVRKTYIARLAGNAHFLLPRKGVVDLPLSSDFFDRPRQIVDREHGKSAVTGYEILERLGGGDDGCLSGDDLLVRFSPHTGRTHQLRVHSAHPDGLGCPIRGDRLYGGQACLDVHGQGNADELCLMAEAIAFYHPSTGERIAFSLPRPQWAG